MGRSELRTLFLAAAVAGAGCASTAGGVVALSQDTYLIARTHYGGIFADMGQFKSDVLRDANDFAASRGKVAAPIYLQQTDPAPGRMPRIEYQFRIVDGSDPLARGQSLTPDNVKREKIDLNIKQQSEPQAKDTYGELLKLDDLRKRGVITEAEFEEQKKRLLSR